MIGILDCYLIELREEFETSVDYKDGDKIWVSGSLKLNISVAFRFLEVCMANKVIFRNPNGDKCEIADLIAMKLDIIEDFDNYWMQGSGDGYIEFFEDEINISTLMLGPNIKYGLYLHFIDNVKKIDLLSLSNENKLNEVAETADEIYASIGLFLPKEKAWEGIQYFVETGKPLASIRWIKPDIIPENGNW